MAWTSKRLFYPLVEGPSGNGPSGSEGEASCNTPPSSRYGTCIDYLKFTFPVGYGKDEDYFRELLKTLRVNMSFVEELRAMHGFTDVVRIAPGTNLAYGGTMTDRKTGESTTMLEMSGEGCRDFEDRYFSDRFMEDDSIDRKETVRGAWIELIEACLRMGGECKRIDLPTDDFSGEITVEEIKQKVARHYYSTSLRALEVTDSKHKGELQDTKTIKDSKLSGYSATFGTRKSLQLCIYDKLSERLASGVDPKVDTWIRYEVRFYHERAQQEIHEILTALKEDKASQHIVGALAAIIDFKEPTSASDKHRSDAKAWSKWARLIKDGADFNGFAVAPRVMSVESNAAWLMKGGAKSFARVLLCLDGKGCAEVGSVLAFRGIGKFDKADLQVVNQMRRKFGFREFESLKDLKSYFLGLPDLVTEFDDKTTELLFDKGTKKELMERSGRSGNDEDNQ